MAVILRIFSGLHLGAEIELSNGTYVIGTDDSCDLILSDSSLSSRHAALRITDENSVFLVYAEPLDGPVSVNDASVHDECELPSGTPFHLGLLAAAWIPADSTDQAAAWAEVDAKLHSRGNTAAAVAAIPEEQKPTLGASGSESAPLFPSDDLTGVPAQSEADTSDEMPSPASEAAPRTPHRARDLGLIAAIILAGTLCFSWNPKPELSPELTVRQLLNEAGYQSLQVSGSEDSVTVTGRIATDRERGRLLRLAQMLPFPVYLDVTVRSDVADAVRASFNTLSLWPEVTELPPSGRPGIRVRGYIKNGIIEQQALSNAIRNVPALRAPEGGKALLEIFRDIKHEEDVQALLTPALMLVGVKDVQCTFHPGRIELKGALTPQSKAALDDAVKAVEAQLGVPVPFDIINETEIQTQKTNIYVDQRSPDSRKAASMEKAPDPFKVISVSMGAMKFITLETGERIFEGGELPGGYVLEHIGVDALKLVKNGNPTIYPLRDNHE